MLHKQLGKKGTGKSFDLERLQKIGKVSMKYYKQINNFKLNQEDFEKWISSLKEPMKSKFKKDGLNACRGVLNFQRFYLESRDFGMDEYMKENLSAADYEYSISKH